MLMKIVVVRIVENKSGDLFNKEKYKSLSFETIIGKIKILENIYACCLDLSYAFYLVNYDIFGGN